MEFNKNNCNLFGLKIYNKTHPIFTLMENVEFATKFNLINLIECWMLIDFDVHVKCVQKMSNRVDKKQTHTLTT